jgi:imidazolonepropionase-like amidohydrolase
MLLVVTNRRRPGSSKGAQADLLVLDGDPRAYLSVLGCPQIVLRGQRLP